MTFNTFTTYLVVFCLGFGAAEVAFLIWMRLQ